MRIIPAIDIINGNAVRLEKGDFSKKTVYAKDPVEVAKKFSDAGIKYLHLVDLDGAKLGKVQNLKILERIKLQTSLIVDFGGGIRSIDDIESLFSAGADQINIGSLSVKNPETMIDIIAAFDPQKIILSPDVINKQIAINGWQEESQMDIMTYIGSYKKKGISYFVCTDIEKDGMLQGSSVGLYEEILNLHPNIKLIASGGVKGLDELEHLKTAGLDGVIIGKAIYEGKISLEKLEGYVV